MALSRLRRPQECEELIAQYQRVKSGVNIRMANEYAVDEARFALHGTLPASLIEIPSRTERAGWLWRLRRFEALLALCEEQLAAGARGATRFSWLRRKCDALLRLDRGEEARVVAREALALAQTMNAGPKLGQPADNWRLAIALAHLGRAEEALARAQSYVDGVPAVSLGRRWSREIEQARIHVLVGRHATCVELLAKLLRVPSGLTVPMLKVEPDWDALREDAAFKALLADPRNLEPL